MNWIIALGASSLGIVIGILVAWFVLEAKEMNLKVLSASVTVLTGGAVMGLFQFLSHSQTSEIWFYPIGLLVGFCAASIIDTIYYGYDPNRPKRTRAKNSN